MALKRRLVSFGLLRTYATPLGCLLLLSVASFVRVQFRPVLFLSQAESGSLLRFLIKTVWPSPGTASIGRDPDISLSPVPVLDVTILLHTSRATWDTRAKAIKDTWLSQALPANMQLFWVLDENMTSDPTILISHSTKPGLISRKEAPAAMDERIIQAFVQAHLLKAPSKWYLKIDDDTYVNTANLQKTIDMLGSIMPSTSRVYAGKLQSCRWEGGMEACYQLFGAGDEICDPFKWLTAEGVSIEHPDTYACGGPGYLLSHQALKALVDYEQLFGCPRGPEDMMIGWVMQGPLSASSFHLDDFLSDFWDGGIDYWDAGRKGATVHKVRPESMYNLWKRASNMVT